MLQTPLVFEISQPGSHSELVPPVRGPQRPLSDLIPEDRLRQQLPQLPEVAEVDVIRHYTRLSQMNYGVDSGFYPLGSCTMKYNPKINEEIARLPGFAQLHPLQPRDTVQGALNIMFDLDKMLCEITGMHRFTLQPAAGAQGELAGLMMIRAYHQSRGEDKRRIMLVPDSAHGTNPASATMAGFKVVEVPSGSDGCVDVDALRGLLGPDTAGLMLTNPNTLGLFEKQISRIADLVHEAGGLLYYDGANANAVLGITRPGDMGFDVVHLNLHKTFSTPHGGGGPGAGPVGVKKELEPFLPQPLVGRLADGTLALEENRPRSIGRVKSFYGHFAVLLRAWAYIRSNGAEGLRHVAESAVLNANYLRVRLAEAYDLPFDRFCMHEVVFSGARQKARGVSTLDIAKRLLDYGYHPPTIYFPLIVKEALMIEPTETERKETLDAFADALLAIDQEINTEPELVRQAPQHTTVARIDEVQAARQAVLRYHASQ
ncbi:MAG: aminomethyl-transferring glycine dehydrogenase subunit GcvPB [Ruminococcaceae bacterium]|nr:aminomethyl-transferring glycine dehydrogenase subunit GcvPB [Oscillospiraceae bacterium]